MGIMSLLYSFLLPIGISAVSWRAYYWAIGKWLPDSILPRNFGKYEQAKSQLLSLTGCSLTLAISSIFHVPKVLENFPDLSALFGLGLDDAGRILHIMLAGYFINDTIWCIQNKYNDPANWFHHAISLGMNVAALLLNNTCYETIMPLWCSEMSTIPLNLRFFHKMKYGTNSKALDYTFAGLFFAGRICGGSWIMWHFCKTPGPMWVRYIGIGAFFLNAFWFSKIMAKTTKSKK